MSSQTTLEQDNTQRLINMFIKINGIVKLSNCQQGRVTMATLLTPPVCSGTTRFHQYRIGYIKIFDICISARGWCFYAVRSERFDYLGKFMLSIVFLRVVSCGYILWIRAAGSRAAFSSRGAPLATSLRL